MPLVRISHTSGKSAAIIEKMSLAVHRAMVETFGVPQDDRFQIITSHDAASGIVGPKAFLGIAHSEDLVFIQITCADGRTVEQKKALYAAIATHLSRDADILPEDVIINLVETKRENWSFGNGLAQFAN
jgi:4-oxalocrotonate tautomerase